MSFNVHNLMVLNKVDFDPFKCQYYLLVLNFNIEVWELRNSSINTEITTNIIRCPITNRGFVSGSNHRR